MLDRLGFFSVSIRAQGCDGYAAPYLYGMPGLGAIHGCVHAMLRQAAGDCSGVVVTGKEPVMVLVSSHRNRVSENGAGAFTQIMSGTRDVRGKAQLDFPRFDIELVLIVGIEVPVAGRDEAISAVIRSARHLRRFAGGRAEVVGTAWHETPVAALAQFGALFAMRPYELPDSDDPFRALCTVVSSGRGKHSGWFLPAMVGYRLLDEPRLKEGTRISPEGVQYPHAYAEALVGAVEMVGATRLLRTVDRRTGVTSPAVASCFMQYQRNGRIIRFDGQLHRKGEGHNG